MKRLIWLMAILLTLSLVLTGCQAGTSQSGGVEDKLQIGMVFDSAGTDNPFFVRAQQGLERAGEQFGDRIQTQTAEPSQDAEGMEIVTQFAENGFDMVICVGSLFTHELSPVAQKFPDTHFVLLDNSIPGLTTASNISCVSFREQECAFLIGAMTALVSESGTIGFVGGMKLPPVERIEAGYRAGAQYIKPDITFISEYIGYSGAAFNDPAAGKALAQKELDQGADVILQAAGVSGNGVLEAAAAKGKRVIGHDIDWTLTAPENQREYILTSLEKKLDEAVFLMIESLVDGKLQGGYTVLGLKEDCLSYSENQYNQDLIADIKPRLEEIKAKIISGELTVPEK